MLLEHDNCSNGHRYNFAFREIQCIKPSRKKRKGIFFFFEFILLKCILNIYFHNILSPFDDSSPRNRKRRRRRSNCVDQQLAHEPILFRFQKNFPHYTIINLLKIKKNKQCHHSVLVLIAILRQREEVSKNFLLLLKKLTDPVHTHKN